MFRLSSTVLHISFNRKRFFLFLEHEIFIAVVVNTDIWNPLFRFQLPWPMIYKFSCMFKMHRFWFYIHSLIHLVVKWKKSLPAYGHSFLKDHPLRNFKVSIQISFHSCNGTSISSLKVYVISGQPLHVTAQSAFTCSKFSSESYLFLWVTLILINV